MYIHILPDARGKLRLRIVNATGYSQHINCQGPRAIRKEGAVYMLRNPRVALIQKAGHKPFYKLPNDIGAY